MEGCVFHMTDKCRVKIKSYHAICVEFVGKEMRVDMFLGWESPGGIASMYLMALISCTTNERFPSLPYQQSIRDEIPRVPIRFVAVVVFDILVVVVVVAWYPRRR